MGIPSDSRQTEADVERRRSALARLIWRCVELGREAYEQETVNATQGLQAEQVAFEVEEEIDEANQSPTSL